MEGVSDEKVRLVRLQDRMCVGRIFFLGSVV
jgi:hypothetical protein